MVRASYQHVLVRAVSRTKISRASQTCPPAAGVIEPARVKRQAIQSAAETAILLIRVDDMMVTQTKAPGMPDGM